MNGITELLKKYGTSLEETRALMPKLTEAVKRQRAIKPPALPQVTQFFTPEEVKGMGLVTEAGEPFELELGWTLKLTPPVDGKEPTFSYITPEKWEITQEQIYISPEGKRFTREQIEAQLAAPEVPLEVEQVFGRLYPSDEFIPDVETVLRWAEEKPEEFLESIWSMGRTEDTEAALKMMFPEITPEQLEEFFAPAMAEAPLGAPIPPPEVIKEAGGKAFKYEGWSYPAGYGLAGVSTETDPMWMKALNWAFWPFTAVGASFARMWSPQKIVGLTPEGFEFEPFPVPQFAEDYSKVSREELADMALQETMANIKEMGIPESQWDMFLLSVKTFFGFTIAQQMATMPGGVIAEEYEKLPWWKQMIAEAPLWVALAGVPGAQAIKARLAAKALEPGVKGVAARVAGVAITPAARVEAGISAIIRNTVGRVGNAVFNKLNLEATKRQLIKTATTQGITMSRATADSLLNAYKKAFTGHLERELANWIAKRGVQMSDDMVNRVIAHFVNRATPKWAADIMLRGLTRGVVVSPSMINGMANTAAREAMANLPAVLDDLAKPAVPPIVGARAPTVVKPPAIKPLAVPEAGALVIVPPQENIINATLQPNWQKSVLQIIGKLPGGERLVKLIDPRELIARDAKAITDIVNRNIIGWQEVIKIGQGVKAIKLGELQAITTDPAGMFGFNKNAYSRMMVERLLPEFEGTVEAGTLEHVFTRPEMYNWKGFDKGLDYVSTVHRINTEVLNMLRAEGVAPEHVVEGWWIHRVVQGKYNPDGEIIAIRGRPGMRGRLAAKRAYEMHRKAPTMHEGMVWKIKYAENPELSITTYIEEAFSKIAGERFYKGTDEALREIGKPGKSPLEVLAEKHPDVAKRAEITAKEKGYAEKALGVIKNVIRGLVPPMQTLNAIERHFPEIGKRLKALSVKNVETENDLRQVLSNTKRTIANLQKIVEQQKVAIEKAKVKDAASLQKATEQARKQIEAERAESLKIMPDEFKLKDVFRTMDYDERMAFRDALDSQLLEIGQLLYEEEAELQGLLEYLRTDPIASYRGTVGKKGYVKLTSVLVGGRFPESVTPKQAAMLLMKPIESIIHIEREGIHKGRVLKQNVLDQLSSKFNMTDNEFEAAVEAVYQQEQSVGDLRVLTGVAQDRYDAIKRLIELLDGVNAKPENIPTVEPEPVVQPEIAIPKAPPGMPEAGLQTDIFGYQTPHFPKGKGEIKQISMDDYQKLVKAWKDAGLPEESMPVAISPKVEGIPGMEAETTIQQVSFDVPEGMTTAERLAELKALKTEVQALVDGKKIAYLQARMARTRVMERIKQAPIGEGYLMQSRFAGKIYDQEFIDAVNAHFGQKEGSKSLKFISDAAGILRITKASLDLSFHAIQGMPAFGLAASYMMTNPIKGARMMGAWFNAQLQAMRGVFDPVSVHAYIAKYKDDALQRVSFGGSSAAVDYFETLRTGGGLAGFVQKGMLKIPFKPYHRAEFAFYGAGEIIRNEFWNVLKDEAIKNGKEYEAAKFLDRMTGIISTEAMGVPLTTRQLESAWVWFAPRYTRACLTILGNVFRGGYTGGKARRALGGMIAAGVAMYAGVQYAKAKLEGKDDEEAWNSVLEGFGVYHDPILDTWEWKPSARLMTFKIGNYNMGIGGFWYGLVRLTGNIMATIDEVGDREIIDFVKIIKNGTLNRDNPFLYWWLTRSSPFLGVMKEAGGSLLKSIAGLELFAGSDFLGYPIETPWDYMHYILTRFEPIWAEQGLNWMIPGMAREQEIPEGIVRFLLPAVEMFGLRTFPISSWVEFYDKATEYINRLPLDLLDDYYTEEELAKILDAQRQGKLKWEHLPELLQDKLLEMYPDLRGIREEALDDSSLRGGEDWKQWEAATDNIKDEYYDRGNILVDRLQRGDVDTREFREFWSEAGQNYGIALNTIKDQEFYRVIYDYFEKKRAEGTDYDWDLDLALLEYQTVVFTEYVDEKGDIDWDAKDKAIADYIERWGEDVYMMIRQTYAEKKEMAGLSPILTRLSDDKDKLTREYWQLPYKSIKDMDLEDETDGNIPAEYYGLWKQYQALETDAERDAFTEKYPDMAKDWRAEYRLAHSEEDAILALWGYGGKLQTREAYDLVEKWSQELGTPMSQMGLGLPPRNLVNQYFEHADIVRQTSGGSVETKLYKLEHPEWLAWGVENWGWSDLSDENINALRLRVEHKDLFAHYEGYGDRHSELYIEDDKARAGARDKLLEENPIFRDDRRRVEAYQLDFPDEQIESYVEYSSLPVKGFEQERYLLEHPEFHKSMIELKDIVPFDPGYKVPDARYDEIYRRWEDLFEQYEAVTGTKSQRKAAREKILVANPEFAFDLRRREAYGKFIPEEHVDTYADWYITKPQKSDDPWFSDHPGETYYGDDWWLMDHMEFYDTMVAMELWEERDFSKVPSKEVFALYKTYQGLPAGTPRFDFRARHPDLDAWGVLKFGWEPIGDRGKKEAPKTPWEIQQEVERFKEKF